MCTNLVELTPSIKLLPKEGHGFSGSVNVPCGYCEECLQAKRREYEFRFSYEFSRLEKLGGRAIMLLLSFKKKNVAVIHTHDFEEFHRGINVRNQTFRTFDGEFLKTFKNRLRKEAWKLWKKGCFRFFYAPEFGENGSHQPHYHAIFFLMPYVDPDRFYDLVRRLWDDTLHAGFVFPNFKESRSNDGKIIRRYFKYDRKLKREFEQPILIKSFGGAAMYCAKYVTKQFLLAGCKDFLDWYRAQNKATRKLLNRYVPRYTFSKSFGMQVIDDENLTDITCLHRALTLGVKPKYFDKSVSLPKYVIRALFYDNIKLGDISKTTGLPLYTAVPSSLMVRYVNRYNLPSYNAIKPLAFQFLSFNKDISLNFEQLSKAFILYHRYSAGSSLDDRFADFVFNKLHPLEDSIISLNGVELDVQSEIVRTSFTDYDTFVERFIKWLDDISHTNMEASVKKAQYFYKMRVPLL